MKHRRNHSSASSSSSSFILLRCALAFAATGMLLACSGKTLDVGTANEPQPSGNGTGAGSGNGTGNETQPGTTPTTGSSSSSCDEVATDGPWRACVTSNGLLARYQTPAIYTERNHDDGTVMIYGIHGQPDESADFQTYFGVKDFEAASQSFTIEERYAKYPSPLEPTKALSAGRVQFTRREEVAGKWRHWAATGGTITCERSETRILCRFHDVSFIEDIYASGTSLASGWFSADLPK